MCHFLFLTKCGRMALILLYSFILFSLTLSLGLGANSGIRKKCEWEMKSAYSSVTHYCELVLYDPNGVSGDDLNNTTKANVCNELIDLFEKICMHNITFNVSELPRIENVSKDTCLGLCSLLKQFDIKSCKSMCSKDQEEVAVHLTLNELNFFFPESELEKEGITEAATLRAPKGGKNETSSETTVKPTTTAPKGGKNETSSETTVKPTTTAPKGGKNETSSETTVKPTTTAPKGGKNETSSETTVKPTTTAPKGGKNETSSETTVKPTTTAPKGGKNETSSETTVKPTTTGVTDIENSDDGYSTNTDGNSPQEDSVINTDNEDNGNGNNKNIVTNNVAIPDDTSSSYHFLAYFLTFIVLCVAGYIVFHNKQKIIAFIIEGKQGRRSGRPSTKQYTPLKSKVEDVMPYVEKSTTKTNYIY